MKAQILLSLFLTATVAGATPREHKVCPVMQKISDPENSAGYYVSDDCLTAYVLPPNEGKISVGPLSSPETPTTCREMNASMTALGTVINARQAYLNQKAQLLAAIAADQQACGPVHSRQQAIQKQIAGLQDEIAKNKLAQDAWKQIKSKCDSNPDGRDCDKAEDRISSLQDRIDNDQDKLEDWTQKADATSEKVADCESRHPHSNENNTPDLKDMDDLTAKIEDYAKKANDARSKLSGISGGEAALNFESGQQQMVKAYADQNKGLGVTFLAMPIKNATIHFELVRDGRATGLASVSRFKINGASKKLDVSAANGADLPNSEDAEVLFGAAVGAQMSVNLYAACNMRQMYSDLSSSQARLALANLVRPTVHYEYELQATKNIKLNYNQSYLYQLIKEHTTHGGLFWSSSSQSITETTTDKTWLTITENSDDSDWKWADPEKVLFDLRREVLDAALSRVAKKMYETADEALADGGTPPEDGASVAAKNLRKFPNVYCQVAAMALDVGNALFGGSSSSGGVMKSVNLSDIENLEINGMVKFSGTQSFLPAVN